MFFSITNPHMNYDKLQDDLIKINKKEIPLFLEINH